MKRTPLALLAGHVVVAASGCAMGVGHINPGGERRYTVSPQGPCIKRETIAPYDRRDPVTGTTYRVHGDTKCTEYGPATGGSFKVDMNKTAFGVATGLKSGYGWAKVGDQSVSGQSIDLFFELTLRLRVVSIAAEVAYSRHNLSDLGDDTVLTGYPVALRLMVPVSKFSLYGGAAKFYNGNIDLGYGDGWRGQAGALFPLYGGDALHVIGRLEGQYTTVSDLNYDSKAIVGAAVFAF